jgi:hypothetical protein
MGLFSDLFGSSSHTQQTTSTSNVTNTQLAGGNIDAPVIYGNNNRQTTVLTDQGTVLAATDISKAALELGATEAATGSAVAIAGLAHAGQAYTSSLQFAGGVTHDAMTGTTAVATDAISAASDNLNSSLQAVTSYAGKALDSVTRYSQSSLDSVNTLAQQVSQSSQQATDTTVKSIILYLVLGVSIVFLAKAKG